MVSYMRLFHGNALPEIIKIRYNSVCKNAIGSVIINILTYKHGKYCRYLKIMLAKSENMLYNVK